MSRMHFMHLCCTKSYFGLNLSLVVVHVLTEINSARTSPLPLSTLEELHQCQWEALPREKHRETLELLALFTSPQQDCRTYLQVISRISIYGKPAHQHNEQLE